MQDCNNKIIIKTIDIIFLLSFAYDKRNIFFYNIYNRYTHNNAQASKQNITQDSIFKNIWVNIKYINHYELDKGKNKQINPMRKSANINPNTKKRNGRKKRQPLLEKTGKGE